MKFPVAAALACCLLASCSGASEEYNEDADESFELSDSSEVRAGETYEEFDARRDEIDGAKGSLSGYGCTVDCSGHDAGYQWAEENSITDPDDCGGKSWSFEEGCQAYASEQSEDTGTEYDEGEY